MKQFRCNIFETNSSSSHSLVIADSETIKKFIEGEMLFNTRPEHTQLPEFVTYKQAFEYAKNHSDDEREMIWFRQTFLSINEIEEHDFDPDNEERNQINLQYYFG